MADPRPDPSGRPPGRPPGARSLLGRAARLALFALPAVLLVGFGATRLYAHRAEADYPRLGEFVEVEGRRQHVLERGSGPPIVLVHGAFGALQDFEATILDELATRYRCILWDRPGHGYSERLAGEVDPGVQARLLLELIDTLGLERPLLVGFSYGGAVALTAALEEPERLRGVVLLNGPSHPWPDPLELHYRLPAVPILGPLLTETLITPLGALRAEASVARAFAPLETAPGFAASPIPLSLRPASFRANAEDMRLLKPFLASQTERYGSLAVPLTMLVSEGDLVVSPTLHSLQLEEAAPSIEVVRIPGAGHQLLYTHPELVLAKIDAAMAHSSAP